MFTGDLFRHFNEMSRIANLMAQICEDRSRELVIGPSPKPVEEQFLPARRYASLGYRDRNVSVCPSVCHAPVLCQNEES